MKFKLMLIASIGIMLASSLVWAARKIVATQTEHNLWTIAVTQDDTNGASNDPVNVIRILDSEHGVVCYLTITTTYAPGIYCLKDHQ